MKTLFTLIMTVTIFLGFSCAQEENPNRRSKSGESERGPLDEDAASSKRSGGSNEEDDSKKTSPGATEESKTTSATKPQSAVKVDQATLDLFDSVCVQGSGKNLQAVAEEWSYLCVDGKATDLFKDKAKNAYTGNGDPIIDPEVLSSANDKTEILVVSAIGVDRKITEVTAKRSEILSLNTSIDDVTITQTIREELEGGDQVVVDTHIQTSVLFVDIHNEMVELHQRVDLGLSQASMSFSTLKEGEAKNSDVDPRNKSVTLFLEHQPGSTLTVNLTRKVVDNQGFGDIAEQKATSQVLGITKEIFNILTK